MPICGLAGNPSFQKSLFNTPFSAWIMASAVTTMDIEELKATYSRELAAYTQRQWNAVKTPHKKDSQDSSTSTASAGSDELESVRKSDKPRPRSYDGALENQSSFCRALTDG